MNPILITTTSEFDVLIIIPTVAKSEVLLPSFERLLKHLDGQRTHIVVSVNPLDQVQAEASIAGMKYLWDRIAPKGCALTIYRHPEACGFGGAINRGLRAACGMGDEDEGTIIYAVTKATSSDGHYGIPESGITVIWNDDLHVTDGWLLGMMAALKTENVSVMSEVPMEDGYRPVRSMADYGTPGMVGPITNVAAGIQVINPDNRKRFEDMGLDNFSAWWREQNHNNGIPVVYTANFLSGYCQGYTAELVQALVERDDKDRVVLFDESYLIAGYEDNDLCVRADLAGFRAVVAYDTFIGHLGHQTFDDAFPDMERGMRNRGVYYDNWLQFTRPEGEQNLTAVFRVRLDVPHDVNMFRMAMAGIGRLVDNIAILLTGPLSAIKNHPEYAEAAATKTLPGDAVTLAGYGPDQEVRGLRQWAKKWSSQMQDSRNPKVMVERWDGDFNERVERNHVISMARGMGADWILSVDHDETIEPRVNRRHFDRLMMHPDPMVQEWDFSWVNHWGNNRWMNISAPWGDSARYTGGMHGYRLFRVNKTSPRSIMAGSENGLHCGNIPMVGPIAKRVSGIRFRHFGYMRVQDRTRKLGRYNEQDPTPNPVLVGGTSYAHITHEENQLMSAFVPVNGIGVHFLCYEGESTMDVGRNLDSLYGLADRMVGVWTGEWADADRRKIYHEPAKAEDANLRGTMRPKVDLWGINPEDWPETGPSLEMAKMTEHFGVEWIHHPLNDHIAEARNAAIDALHGTKGMGWGYFFDPDEHAPPNVCVALRRMAEVTDSWGWLMAFRNNYSDGRYNMSESVRMHRLDVDGRMRMNGRVHESFQAATKQLGEDGFGRVVRRAPEVVLWMNQGLAGEPVAMQDKLDRYKRLTELELEENPDNPGAWTTLGLYWTNEGYRQVAMECFARGMIVATGEFLPFREAGLEYLRLAANCYREVDSRTQGLRSNDVTKGIIDFLESAAPQIQIQGVPGRQGLSEAEALATLPAMPEAPKVTLSFEGTIAVPR